MSVNRRRLRTFRSCRLVCVVETSGIWRKSKASQIASGQSIRHPFPSLNIEQLKCTGALPTLFDFIQEQPAILRHAQRDDRCVNSRFSRCRIDKELILSSRSFA